MGAASTIWWWEPRDGCRTCWVQGVAEPSEARDAQNLSRLARAEALFNFLKRRKL